MGSKDFYSTHNLNGHNSGDCVLETLCVSSSDLLF